MKIFPFIRYSLLLMLSCAACTKQAEKTMFDNQEKKIESFVSAQLKANPEAEAVYQGGTVRIILTPGEEGATLQADGRISFYYAGYVLNGTSVSASNLFATNREDLSASWSLSDEESFAPVLIRLQEAQLVEGLRKGLEGVRTGEECYIVFSGKYGFGDKAYGTIPANAALVYRIWVNSIENN